jgi:phosphonate transport system permease protein
VSRRVRGGFQRTGLHGTGVLRSPTELHARGGRMPILWGALLLAVSFHQSGVLTPGAPGHLLRFVAQLFPPDLSPSFLATVAEPLWQTIAISVVGTAIGIALGALLALPATATLMLDDRDPAGAAGRALRRLAYLGARGLLALLRSIPELVWVLLCILAFGLGAFAGAAALGLHTAGVLGKLYAETLEDVPDRPGEELRAAGATPLQRLFWASWPQARETLASYTLLRWETNLRLSTVVGLVGGGGLGLALYNDVQLGWYPRASTLVLIIYLLVVVTDFLASRLRAPPPTAAALEAAPELLSATAR